MNWNFLAVWIGMKTCDAHFGPRQLAVAPRGFALHSCHNVCHAQMCPAFLVHTMSSFEKYCPLGLAANWPAKATSSTQKALLRIPSCRRLIAIVRAAKCRACDKQKMVV